MESIMGLRKRTVAIATLALFYLTPLPVFAEGKGRGAGVGINLVLTPDTTPAADISRPCALDQQRFRYAGQHAMADQGRGEGEG